MRCESLIALLKHLSDTTCRILYPVTATFLMFIFTIYFSDWSLSGFSCLGQCRCLDRLAYAGVFFTCSALVLGLFCLYMALTKRDRRMLETGRMSTMSSSKTKNENTTLSSYRIRTHFRRATYPTLTFHFAMKTLHKQHPPPTCTRACAIPGTPLIQSRHASAILDPEA